MTAALPAIEPLAGGRVAFVHDYLTQIGGAERVAGIIATLMPSARLLTSVHRRDLVPLSFVGGRPWQTSFLQPAGARLPLKAMLPILPRAVFSLDTSGAELLVTSSSAFAHYARPRPGGVHVCICNAPAHFLWSSSEYFRGRGRLRRALSPLLSVLRRLDLEASAGVDVYVAISRHIASRIQQVYGRAATVVYPPVQVSRFAPSKERSGRFLAVARLVRTKHVDLAIEAANRFALPLDVIGSGPDLSCLSAMAGPTVRVHGWQPDEVVRRAMAEATAVIVAGEEDFGLVPVEAQASGRPPIAYAAGGALEIIEDGTTGYLFDEQTPEALGAAMMHARDHDLDAADLRDAASRFDVPVFAESLHAVLATAVRRGAG
jgi:glycosyltransferase involved in cell wall biosynthesis